MILTYKLIGCGWQPNVLNPFTTRTHHRKTEQKFRHFIVDRIMTRHKRFLRLIHLRRSCLHLSFFDYDRIIYNNTNISVCEFGFCLFDALGCLEMCMCICCVCLSSRIANNRFIKQQQQKQICNV